MPITVDSALGVYADALALRAKRAEVLASNLANVDTPNYKARDFDFHAVLAQAQQTAGSGTLTVTHASHISGAGANGALPELVYRVPLHSSLDGNTVDASQEQAAFADNALHYRATLTFLSSRMRGLLTAIRGE